MDKNYLRKLIRHTLEGVEGAKLWSEKAEDLLMGTCAQESALGRYRRQIGGGPALGIFQMEPETFNNIKRNYLAHKKTLCKGVLKAMDVTSLNHLIPEMLECDDELAIIFARLHYRRVSEPIPETLEGQALYYKQYYNTYQGKATVSDYLQNYVRYVQD